ncbi:FAD-dependent oxidoreductase [Microbulbifer taiwanensis]|uniref:FAD-dependent oxidoreductase n=1 Tax=Microbulbifer taiwanensis TaxID=986746 RepID=A0ABW1YT70_9GAMM
MPPPRAIQQARRILVLGAGLIGCELAMDMASDGREVTLLDLADSPLSALLPATLTSRCNRRCAARGQPAARAGSRQDRCPAGRWLAGDPDRWPYQRAGSGDRRDRPAAES